MKKYYVLIVVGLMLVSCSGGGSSSGGGSQPIYVATVHNLGLCQVCSVNENCASNDCRRFSSGAMRCVPTGAAVGYLCPTGNYKLVDGGAKLVEDALI
jgi:hypothetical protein